ncbi:hypothetical protein DFQ28_005156 [Apophysomyces sp. BC1034]|nr:hypothetical protein DFQ28_005156 [Apophysomyces sp. BC1034]
MTRPRSSLTVVSTLACWTIWSLGFSVTLTFGSPISSHLHTTGSDEADLLFDGLVALPLACIVQFEQDLQIAVLRNRARHFGDRFRDRDRLFVQPGIVVRLDLREVVVDGAIRAGDIEAPRPAIGEADMAGDAIQPLDFLVSDVRLAVEAGDKVEPQRPVRADDVQRNVAPDAESIERHGCLLLSQLGRLAVDLDALTPFNIYQELLDNRQVNDLHVGLHVAQRDARHRVVRRVDLNAGIGDVVGHPGVVVPIRDRVAAGVVPETNAEHVARRDRVGNQVDTGLPQRLQFCGTVGQVLVGLLRPDDAVERLVQAGLFRRQVRQTASDEALRRNQADLPIHRVVEVAPIAEQQLGRIAVDACGRLDGRRVADRVASRAGQDHVDAFGQAEGHLIRPRRAVVAVGQHGDAGVGAAQRVHALAGNRILTQQDGRADGRRAVGAAGQRIAGQRRGGHARASGCDDQLRRPAETGLAVVDSGRNVLPQGIAGTADVVEDFRHYARYADGRPEGAGLAACGDGDGQGIAQRTGVFRGQRQAVGLHDRAGGDIGAIGHADAAEVRRALQHGGGNCRPHVVFPGLDRAEQAGIVSHAADDGGRIDRPPLGGADDAEDVGRQAVKQRDLRGNDLDINVRHDQGGRINRALLNNRHGETSGQ